MLQGQLLLFDFRCVAHFNFQNSIRQILFANYGSNIFSKPNDYPLTNFCVRCDSLWTLWPYFVREKKVTKYTKGHKEHYAFKKTSLYLYICIALKSQQ
jgi:hypothetical protein